ncbi:protein neprosin-like [Tasmannia lanceolata]|uniref:protein neprosin-like n=1 Tax=Tasmannia lanceolata TaxID=3420 RepID=UPI00406497EF
MGFIEKADGREMALNGIVLSLLALSLVIVSQTVEGGRTSLSREEDLELDRQLKVLNKPTIKTIQTEYGQIFDCVDIHKQPAFDHPLLKNHKIRMSPGSLPKGMIDERVSSVGVPSEIGLKDGGCPHGTVPIRRIQKEDLIKSKSLQKIRRSYSSRIMSPQFRVHPELYNDTYLHLHSYWTADNADTTGCYDVLCPGFVQVSRYIPMGVGIDPVSKDWWLLFGGENTQIGYWPKTLFSTLFADKARTVQWGGQVFNPGTEAWPPMGSGHLPSEGGYKTVSYISMIQLIDEDGNYKRAPSWNLESYVESSVCYNVAGDQNLPDGGYSLFFGGPGGECSE